MTAAARPPAATDADDFAVMQARANAELAHMVVRELRDAGVQWVVASPGGRNIPLLLAAEACDGLRVVSVIDERQAGFVALGLAKTSGLPVATLATSGSAVAHFLPAVLEASEDDVPWVVVSADRPAELHGFGAPQTTTQVGLLAPAVRHTEHLDAPESSGVDPSTRTKLCRTITAASQGRPGPVHLNVAFREPLWHPDVKVHGESPRLTTEPHVATELAPELAQRLVKQLSTARRGLIVCGPRIGVDDEVDAILALAQRLGWPVVADATSNLRYQEHSDATVISAHEAIARSASGRRARPDLILRFGREPIARSSWEWLRDLGPSVARIHVEASGRWFDPFRQATELVSCAPARFAEIMIALMANGGDVDPAWRRLWERAEVAAQKVLSRIPDGPLTEASVAQAMIAQLPPGALVFAGNSMPIRDLDLFGGRPNGPVSVVGNRGVNGIDGAIATCVGLALGGSQAATVGLLGDITALHDIGALAIAADLDRGVTLVVVDNNGGRIFEHLPVSSHPDRAWFDRRLATAPRPGLDLADIASGYGVKVRQVAHAHELESALVEEVGRRATSIIVARVDPSLSVAYRRAAIDEAVVAVERAALGGAP